jgi:hypothetical protein
VGFPDLQFGIFFSWEDQSKGHVFATNTHAYNIQPLLADPLPPKQFSPDTGLVGVTGKIGKNSFFLK